MTGYKSVLVCLTNPDTIAPTLSLAISVGREFGAHIEALSVRSDPAAAVPLVGEGMSAHMVEEMLEAAERQSETRTKELRAVFDKTVAAAGIPILEGPPGPVESVSARWREATGREEEVLANAARLSDLVIMARPTSAADASAILTLNAALMESGRPLLMAPPRTPPQFGRNIALFWNGSAEAARAVWFALPFLEKAAKVSIFSAREESGVSPGELADYLSWRGIKAESRAFAAGAQVGQTLLAEATGSGADMVVMGAYTHSRLRQLILGGVTRHVLQAATLPVLFSH